MRMTDAVLADALLRHEAGCETCETGEECDGRRQVEAAFWSEVDRQIDEDKINGRRFR